MQVLTSQKISGGPYDSTSVVGQVNGFPKGNNAVDAAFVASMIGSLITDGIVSDGGNEFKVTAGGGMNVYLAPGTAWTKGYMSKLTESKRFELVAGYTYSIVIRSSTSSCESSVVVIADSAAFTPVRTQTNYDVVVATVTVPASAQTVTQGMITDTRHSSAYCSYVTSKV